MTTKAVRDHMRKVAESGCAICFRLHGPHEPGPVELHHPRRGTGMGQRAKDTEVIGLCVEHHRGNLGVHGLGTKGFEKHYGFSEADLLTDVLQRLQES
jgi:hypothetical protein